MYGVSDTASRHRLKGDIRVRVELKNIKGEGKRKKKMTDISILSSAPKFRARDRKLSSRHAVRVCAGGWGWLQRWAELQRGLVQGNEESLQAVLNMRGASPGSCSQMCLAQSNQFIETMFIQFKERGQRQQNQNGQV